MAIAAFVHGTVGSTMVYGCHELGHGTVFATRWLNRAFLHVYSVLFWWDCYDYAASHTYHHRYSQYPEADRENLFPLTPSLDPSLLVQLFSVNIFSRPGRVFGKGGLPVNFFAEHCFQIERTVLHSYGPDTHSC